MEERRLTAREGDALRGHIHIFSRLGGALLVQTGGALVVQFIVLAAVGRLAPALVSEPVFLGVLSGVSVYGVGFLLFWLVIRAVPMSPTPETHTTLPPVRFFQAFLISMAALYLANYVTLGLTALIGLLRGAPVVNPVETLLAYPLPLTLVLTCVAAPVVEELMFRRLLLRRLQPYGERFAVVASALCFALFHGNLNQMLYAFVLGLIFVYVTLRIGRLWQTMLLHAMVNFMGSCLPSLLRGLGEKGTWLAGVIVLLCIFCGAGCFIVRVRSLRLCGGGYAMPEGQKWRLFFGNPGIICFCLLAAVMAASHLVV